MRYFCWNCYGPNEQPRGACAECRKEIGAPAGTSYSELLRWELGHPLPDRQMLAAQILGRMRDGSASESLRELACGSADPYLAAEALEALLAIDGAALHPSLLQQLAHDAAVPARAVANAALEDLQ